MASFSPEGRDTIRAPRLRQPVQPDLIQRRLFTVHFHAYAAAEYLKKHGQPLALEDLDRHRILAYGGLSTAPYLANINALPRLGRDPKSPRVPALTINNITALHNAVEKGVGISILPDYMIGQGTELVRLLRGIAFEDLLVIFLRLAF